MKINIFNVFFLSFLIFNAQMISCSTKMKTDKTAAFLQFQNKMKSFHAEFTKPHLEKMTLHQQISLLQTRSSILREAIQHHFDNSEHIDHHDRHRQYDSLSLLQKNIDTLNSNLNSHHEHANMDAVDTFNAKKNHREQLQNLDDVHKKYANVPSLIQTIKNNRVKVDFDTGSAGADLGATCLSSITGSIPPSFCFKRGGDAGIIPTMCSCGTFRFLA
jgi:hypothetical protein